MPLIAELPIQSSWWGYYEVSPDHNAIVGESSAGPGRFLYATGFSGHGFQQSPAIGEHLAQARARRDDGTRSRRLRPRALRARRAARRAVRGLRLRARKRVTGRPPFRPLRRRTDFPKETCTSARLQPTSATPGARRKLCDRRGPAQAAARAEKRNERESSLRRRVRATGGARPRRGGGSRMSGALTGLQRPNVAPRSVHLRVTPAAKWHTRRVSFGHAGAARSAIRAGVGTLAAWAPSTVRLRRPRRSICARRASP